MKWKFTLILVLVALYGLAQSQCPPSVTTPWVFNVPETLYGWSHAVHCFTYPCGNAPQWTTARSNVFATALVGPVTVVVSRSNPNNYTVVTAINRATCDTIYGTKCLNPIDSLRFFNPHEFTLWFETDDTTDTIVFVCKVSTGAAQPHTFCDMVSVVPTLAVVPTYRKFDPIRGTTSQPATEQPIGLSLRSDGVKVMRQGLPDGMALAFLTVLAMCSLWPTMRSLWRMETNPDDDDAD